MNKLFRKTILYALVAALGMAAMPFMTVSAEGQIANERLERSWARQLRIYDRIGHGFEHDEEFVERVQTLIDRADANGKDASAVKAALEAFEAALKETHPMYESAKGIVNSHQGFDDSGKVTDPQQAQETVDAMRGKLKEMKAAMAGTGRALREAIRAFREANPHPLPTATPIGG